jgi:hypothetical protein
MKVKIEEEFSFIAKEILSYKSNADEWARVESDDMFQTKRYVGGYDATEEAFCFSYYTDEGKEYWFQLTLDEMIKIGEGKVTEIEVRPLPDSRVT